MYPYYGPTSQSIRTLKMSSALVKEQTPQSDGRLLKLLEQAIAAEMQDAWYYKNLLDKITDSEEASIVKSLYLDECKHKKIFCDLYQQLCGKEAPQTEYEKPAVSSSLSGEYKKRLFDELESIDFYRKILFALPDLVLRDMVFEAVTDEQNHATKLTFLLSCHKK